LLELEAFSAEVKDDFTPYIGKRLSWKTLHVKLRASDFLLRHALVRAYNNEKQAMVQATKENPTAVT
jgi:hypothetical protein